MTSEEFVDELHMVLFCDKFKKHIMEWGHESADKAYEHVLEYIKKMDVLFTAWDHEGFNDRKQYLEDYEVRCKIEYFGVLDHNYNNTKDMLRPRKGKNNDK